MLTWVAELLPLPGHVLSRSCAGLQLKQNASPVADTSEWHFGCTINQAKCYGPQNTAQSLAEPASAALTGLCRHGALDRSELRQTEKMQSKDLDNAFFTIVNVATGHGHNWPSVRGLHVPHGIQPRAAAAGGATAVRQQPVSHKKAVRFTGVLEYPLWWHAPFIAQSGGAGSGAGSACPLLSRHCVSNTKVTHCVTRQSHSDWSVS